MEQLKCTVVDHDEEITAICIEQSCKVGNRLLCVDCIQKTHFSCQNRYYLKKDMLKKLIELKTLISDGQPPDVTNLQIAWQELQNSIKILQQFMCQLLEQPNQFKSDQVKRIDEIIDNQRLLSANHWRDAYQLLCVQSQGIQSNTSQLIKQLDKIKQSIHEIVLADSQSVIRIHEQIRINIESSKSIQLIQNPLKINTKHQVCTIALSPNGRHLASAGSGEFSIQIWELTTGNQVGNDLLGHDKKINSIMYSPCGDFIVSGGDDKTIRVWDVENQTQISETMRGHTHQINKVQYYDDYRIISCSLDQTIRIWDPSTGEEFVHKRIQHTCSIWSMCLSSNSSEVSIGDNDFKIVVWDYNQGLKKGQFIGHSKIVRSIAYSSKNTLMVSGSDDCTIRVWDTITKSQIWQNPIHLMSTIYSVHISPNMKFLLSGGSDGALRIWDRETGKQVENPYYHQGLVMATQFSQDGQYIISGSCQDSQIRVIIF